MILYCTSCLRVQPTPDLKQNRKINNEDLHKPPYVCGRHLSEARKFPCASRPTLTIARRHVIPAAPALLINNTCTRPRAGFLRDPLPRPPSAGGIAGVAGGRGKEEVKDEGGEDRRGAEAEGGGRRTRGILSRHRGECAREIKGG